MKKIPYFTYVLSNPAYKNYGCIEVDGRVIHRIENVNKFYQALGYTEKIAATGTLPDEYIWIEYTKDNSEKATACLQANIIKYLNEHAQSFRKEYGSDYKRWLGSCASNKIRNSPDCNACHMNPNQKTANKD